jgi:cellulose synthase/poly-beta-1,6-N-acetylglucosamine synthase-like glycosyltransferase
LEGYEARFDVAPSPALPRPHAYPSRSRIEETDAWSGEPGSKHHFDDAHDRQSRGGRPYRRDSSSYSRRARDLPAANSPGTKTSHAVIAAATTGILSAVAVIVVRLPVSPVLIGYWILGAAVITVCFAAFVKGRRFTHLPPAQGRVLAIVPAYNEYPQDNLNACIRSLMAQTIPIDKIVVVDDGSVKPVKPFYAKNVEWIRQENTGKRGAQVTALKMFHRDEFQFVLTVDSDSRPHPDALDHLLRAMSNRKVQAATGWLYIRNFAESWVARAADIDIGGSCVMMRASRSFLGALETTSGALALYRSEILYDNLEEYAVECGTGDDRWLAMRALLRGEVVGVAEAAVVTDMPTTLKGTFKQRLRWARSWWWMVPFAYARLSWKHLISPTYGIVSLGIAPVVMFWAVFSWVAGFQERLAHPQVALAFLGSYIAVRYALSALYLAGRPGMSRKQKLISLIVGTPAAVFLNLLLLMPTRYYALTRLNDNRWQTRQVSVGDPQ